MGISKKIFAGVLWSVIANIVNALYGFIAIPLLINHFGKAEYGLIALATSVNTYIQLMDMGLGSTNVRFFSAWLAKGDDDRIKRLFSTSNTFYGFIGVINTIILIIVCYFADSFFNVNPVQCEILRKLLAILAFAALINWSTSCFNQIIQASENVAWIQKRNLMTKCLLIVNLIFTILFDFSIVAYFFNTILCVWIILPLVIKKIRKVAPCISFKLQFDWQIFKEILPYSLNIFSFSIFSFSYNNLRTIFLGVRGSLESVTDYTVINSIAALCSMICGAFLNALLPSSSKAIANGDKAAYFRIAYQGTKYIMLFVSFCVFGLITIGPDLVSIYVGVDFLYLIPWLNLLLLTLLANHILGISSLILGGTNILPLSKMTAISSTIGIVAAWLLIPKYGVGGVVFAAIIYNIGQQLFYYLYYWPKRMSIDSKMIFFRITFPLVLLGGSVYFVVQQIPKSNNNWINVIVLGSAFVFLYLILSWLYLNEKDKDFLIGLINKRKK